MGEPLNVCDPDKVKRAVRRKVAHLVQMFQKMGGGVAKLLTPEQGGRLTNMLLVHGREDEER